MSAPPRAGWLFAYDWDGRASAQLQAQGRAQFDPAGFDLFSFPSNVGLAFYDHERFAQRQAQRGRRLGSVSYTHLRAHETLS
jgi:hypothetical protein